MDSITFLSAAIRASTDPESNRLSNVSSFQVTTNRRPRLTQYAKPAGSFRVGTDGDMLQWAWSCSYPRDGDRTIFGRKGLACAFDRVSRETELYFVTAPMCLWFCNAYEMGYGLRWFGQVWTEEHLLEAVRILGDEIEVKNKSKLPQRLRDFQVCCVLPSLTKELPFWTSLWICFVPTYSCLSVLLVALLVTSVELRKELWLGHARRFMQQRDR